MTCIVLFITLRILQEYGQPGKVDDTKGGQKNAPLYSARTNLRTFYALNSGKLRGMYPDGYQMCDSSDVQTSMNISTKKIILPKKSISVNTLIQGYKQYVSMISYSGRVLMNTIQCFFAQTRGRIAKLYQKALPEPHGDLAFWVVFGYETTSSSTLIIALRKLGVSDMVVASGYQVAYVSMVISFIFSRKKSSVHMICRLLFLWFYVFLVGFHASILRSALSRSFLEIALVSGRRFRSGWTLFLSGAILLLIKPAFLFSLGFQFSFLISAAFILFSSREEYPLSSFTAPILAWYITLPLEFMHEKPIFLSSILAELALLWVCPTLMTLSVIHLFLLWIPGIRVITTGVLYICTTVYLEITREMMHVFNKLPLEVKPSFGVYAVWALIFFILIKRTFQRKTRQFSSFL